MIFVSSPDVRVTVPLALIALPTLVVDVPFSLPLPLLIFPKKPCPMVPPNDQEEELVLPVLSSLLSAPTILMFFLASMVTSSALI